MRHPVGMSAAFPRSPTVHPLHATVRTAGIGGTESQPRILEQSPMIALVASRPNETNNRIADAWRALGLDAVVVPTQWALAQLRAGDVAIGRVDVRRSIDGVEPGLLDLLELDRRGINVINGPSVLITAHDKLRTARVLRRAHLPHPRTEHVTLDSAPTAI